MPSEACTVPSQATRLRLPSSREGKTQTGYAPQTFDFLSFGGGIRIGAEGLSRNRCLVPICLEKVGAWLIPDPKDPGLRGRTEREPGACLLSMQLRISEGPREVHQSRR